jgi:hypothetical protein
MDDREKRARKFARRVFAGATQSLSEKGGKHLWQSHIAVAELDRVLGAAREGDKKALAVLRERGHALRGSGANVPDDFHTFVWEFFLDGAPKGRPGRPPYDFVARNIVIANTIRILIEEFGFCGTRGEASREKGRTVSACRIVEDELPKGHKVGEDAVETIWKDSLAKARMEAAAKARVGS